ncbi:MAG TPA: sigma 54-interacting transcriptional regulator [Candidatus Acidoferrales bacterium]|nr:sigma 54-interacting transcriptional regulator [Candidatus Acidoferrales bacterium]
MHLAPSEHPVVARYEALIRVSQAVSAYREPRKLFDVLVDELHRVIEFDGIGIAQYDETMDAVEWHVSIHCNEPNPVLKDKCVPKESMTCWVFQNQRPLVIPFVDQETRFTDTMEFLKQHGMQSVCMLPLTTVHRRIGSMFIASEHSDAYSDDEVRFLGLVADQMALAIDDALNFEASRTAQEQLKLLLDLTNSVVSTLDLRELLRSVSGNLRRVMNCDLAGVGVPDEENKKHLRLYALDFPDSKGFVKEEVLIPIEGTPPGAAFRSGEPVVGTIRDLCDLIPEPLPLAEGLKMGCVLPLASRGRMHGVLLLGRRDENVFSQDDVKFLMQVASQVAIAVENALAYKKIAELKEKITQEKLYLEDEIRTELNFEEIVGKSAALRRVLQQVATVAPTDSTVLIYGETGTGKELVARAIHNLSSRQPNSFVKLNCAAIPMGLLESELFGHEKGAFTGAIAQRIGRFELANRGTVFLDEVGEIPLELQPKLLRVLQEREFERLGSTRTLTTDARLIAATNRDLASMVDEQKFRSDLFYRLNVFPIRVPSLRERPEDIPLLVRHFTEQCARRMNKKIETISSETLKQMRQYHWPGNIRELQNVIERAVILSAGPVLNVPLSEIQSRPALGAAGRNGKSDKAPVSSAGEDIRNVLEETERKHILRVLSETNWVVAGPNGAAIRLGMKRSTLQLRMRKLGLSRENAQPVS